jgi:ATP/maltotriose-dependent transcriptional regulator MalT
MVKQSAGRLDSGVQHPIAWLTLDENDNDPARFWNISSIHSMTVDLKAPSSAERKEHFGHRQFAPEHGTFC